MLSNYEVISAGHVHRGKALQLGDVVALKPAQAERYPTVFKAPRALPAKAEKAARTFSIDTANLPPASED